MFHITAIINDFHQARALVDDGSSAYATLSERLVKKLKLPTINVSQRQMTGVLDSMKGYIHHVAAFGLDIGGIKSDRVWAYVIPGQTEDVIIGRPWLIQHKALQDPAHSVINFKEYDITLYNEDNTDRKEDKFTRICGASFGSYLRRSKKSHSTIQIFAASLADIDKALRPKPKLSRKEIEARLPDHYKEFAAIFDPTEASKLPPHRPGIDHEIPLEKDEKGKDKEVPWGPLYNMSHDELLVLRKELTNLLDQDFIRISKSPAAAPVLFAKKPGGGLRFCVDYRGLNAITRKDRYPLPLIKETLSALGKAKWLTKLDVSAAFHKVRMAEGEEWKTAFRTRYGLYEWKVCPFGLTGSPATFQRFINWTLKDYLDLFCTAYVDDILIFSSGSRKDHREKVKMVLKRLMDNGLHLDIAKCEFETPKTKYLGFIVEAGVGISMDPQKVEAIATWQEPSSVKGVRSFLGFANYYRIFIKNYSDLARPLTNLTKKYVVFVWGQECQKAFEALKAAFTAEPVLATYDPDLETRVEPDASGWAVGGILSQYDPISGTFKTVAYFSSKHSPAEANYNIHDKELLAIIKCVKEWSSELRGLSKPFVILTDHKNLEPFTTKRLLSERQVRWMEFLSQYNFILKHRPGCQAIIPDALSRREQDKPSDATDQRVVERERTVLPKELWSNVNAIQTHPKTPFLDDEILSNLWNKAFHEPVGRDYMSAFEAVEKREKHFPKELDLRLATGECDTSDGYLRYRDRIWVPCYEPLTTRIIQTIHDSYLGGHPGRDATITLVGRRFFWPGINQTIRNFVKACDICGRTGIWRDKKKGLLKPLPLPSRIWQELSMDFVTGLPPSGDDAVTVMLVITDRLSKGVELIPVPPSKFDAQGTADLFLRYHVPHHWIPKAIVSDRGPQFVNAFWNRICQLVGVKQRLSTAYHPETDGSTERANQEIETYLRTFVAYEQSDWVQWLPMAQITVNNRPKASTNVSPFFMMHGFDAEAINALDPDLSTEGPTPIEKAQAVILKLAEAQDFAQTSLVVAQQEQEKYANNLRSVSPSYSVGDKVWLNLRNIKTTRPSKKLDWTHAKYTVTRVFPGNPLFYELDTPPGIHNKFHTSLLRPAYAPLLASQEAHDRQPPAIINDDGDAEWGVEKILDERVRKIGRGERREVLVQWVGYARPTWQPRADLEETLALDIFDKGKEGGNVTGCARYPRREPGHVRAGRRHLSRGTCVDVT